LLEQEIFDTLYEVPSPACVFIMSLMAWGWPEDAEEAQKNNA
jgi:hypothetical protein